MEKERKKESTDPRKKNKNILRRCRRWYRHHKKQAIYSIALCLCVLLLLVVFVVREQIHQKSLQVTAENAHDVGNSYREIEYEGRHYRYNTQIRMVLYAGIDGTGKMESSLQYGNKARADVISLLVMDKLNKKISVIPISRDTITEIRKFSLNGNDNGLYKTHIGYAYSYGDGGEVSCENLCEAVTNMLGGIPVREYVVTNQDSMPYLNNLVGGVTVTVPNSDLQDVYPEFKEGNRVTINDDNISIFLRSRDTEEDFSNEGRMERQKAYMTAYVRRMQEMDLEEITDMWKSVEDMEEYLQTSISRNEYLELAQIFREVRFSEENFVTLEGEDRQGNLHDEFHLDEEALLKKIIELFYEEM